MIKITKGPFRIWSKETWNEVHRGEPHPEGRQVTQLEMPLKIQYTDKYENALLMNHTSL